MQSWRRTKIWQLEKWNKFEGIDDPKYTFRIFCITGNIFWITKSYSIGEKLQLCVCWCACKICLLLFTVWESYGERKKRKQIVERWREQVEDSSEAESDGESKKTNRIECVERCTVCRRKLQKLNQKLRRKWCQQQVQIQTEMHQVLIWVNKTISLIQPISSCYLTRTCFICLCLQYQFNFPLLH